MANRKTNSSSPSAPPATPASRRSPSAPALSVMNPDGTEPTNNIAQKIVAKNLRNAVAMQWDAASSTLYLTNMGDDQLGNHAPEDPFFAIPASQIETALATNQPLDYGWPYCYFENGTVHPDRLWKFGSNYPTRTATRFPPPTPPSPRTAHRSASCSFPVHRHAAEATLSSSPSTAPAIRASAPATSSSASPRTTARRRTSSPASTSAPKFPASPTTSASSAAPAASTAPAPTAS